MLNIADQILIEEKAKVVSDDELARLAQQRLARMRTVIDGPGQKGCTPKQKYVIDDLDAGTKYIAVRCPRRSGKSFIMALLATYVGESRPGCRILVISLTLKSTKENYWSGSPSGIFTMDRLYDLGLSYNHTDLVWHHQNGSRGRLAGAETRADIEYLRGAAAEADVVILDECKSFAPGLLTELIREVLEPGLMTRDGVIIMGGTPGLIPLGPFYEATCEASRVKLADGTELPTCYRYTPDRAAVRVTSFVNEHGEEEAADEPWSLHFWTVQDNVAAPKQWQRALRIKRRAGWSDDHPTWRREYLGEWVQDGEGLVYTFAAARAAAREQDRPGFVTWEPDKGAHGITGLDPDDGPWHLIWGLDLGFEDDTALVIAAYSEQLTELRHIDDFKSPHMYPPEVRELLEDYMARYGHPEAIVGDAGNLAKMLIEWFTSTGIPMEKAEKTEKNDYIELMNGDFLSGRIKIIEGSDLDHELSGLQWDLSQAGKAELVRTGKLREDRRLPNHLCDALLYLWRYSYHHFGVREERGPEKGTPAWWAQKEREAELKAAYEKDERTFAVDGYPGARRGAPLTRDTVFAQLGNPWRYSN